MHNNDPSETSGALYVVATPIGNRDDITLRALRVLETVDVIAAEDTRHTGRFLQHHGITGRYISYHEHNEKERAPDLLNRLSAGKSIALVTSAGTPSISDPGFRLIQKAIDADTKIIPIPGVSAVIAALSASGLPTDAFVFVGFLSRRSGRRTKQLQAMADETRTMIIYESPNRIVKLLELIHDIMGDRQAVLAREMTKLHEEFLRGSISTLQNQLEDRRQIKGECTLLIAGSTGNSEDAFNLASDELAERLANDNQRLSELAREISKKYGLSKKTVYDKALKIKGSRRK
jgi:16S rRNA (cytidine1402-2'-O)-methyltransferase